ncbi:MAG: type III-B CRISPR module RAMP protein Cmr4 [Anaerolineales bacterium]|nr:type III-B CRISPR module RAMP protein Cmr4 [Anaerolineales bacterium]
MKAKLLFTHALTPLHPGTGQGTGVIDLPIAREVATGIPYLPGSSLKGVLRDRYGDAEDSITLFGPKPGNISGDNSSASALQFTDQRLLLLPVRSLAGTFAWITSPFILQRFKRTLGYLDINDLPDVPQPNKEEAYTAVAPAIHLNNQVIIEDLDFTAVTDSEETNPTTRWANWISQYLFPNDAPGKGWRKTFNERFCIIHDDRLSFLLETATEVIARNVLDENKTSQNLWYEEALPAETVLVGLITAQPVGTNGMNPNDALNKVPDLIDGLTQLGGHATIGRGLCRLISVMNGG